MSSESKTPRQKIEVNLHDFGLESRFLDTTSRSQVTKEERKKKGTTSKVKKKRKQLCVANNTT